jgi:TusA-related sulfurtransferase
MSKLELDITKEHCPMTFVRVKLALEKLPPGDRLEVLLAAGEPLESVPRSATEQGFRVVEVVQVSEGIHRVVIER